LLSASASSHHSLSSTAFISILQNQIFGVALLGARPPVRARRISGLAAMHRLPTMFEAREFVDDGGLISYGPNITDVSRRAATFVVKVLNGAKPADLPIEQPTRFQLVINLKTAKALGLTIPPGVLAIADEVIE
jgi:putative ABC transport system substrate-binding protein